MDLQVKFLSIEDIEMPKEPVKKQNFLPASIVLVIGLLCMFGLFVKAYKRMMKQEQKSIKKETISKEVQRLTKSQVYPKPLFENPPRTRNLEVGTQVSIPDEQPQITFLGQSQIHGESFSILQDSTLQIIHHGEKDKNLSQAMPAFFVDVSDYNEQSASDIIIERTIEESPQQKRQARESLLAETGSDYICSDTDTEETPLKTAPGSFREQFHKVRKITLQKQQSSSDKSDQKQQEQVRRPLGRIKILNDQLIQPSSSNYLLLDPQIITLNLNKGEMAKMSPESSLNVDGRTQIDKNQYSNLESGSRIQELQSQILKNFEGDSSFLSPQNYEDKQELEQIRRNIGSRQERIVSLPEILAEGNGIRSKSKGPYLVPTTDTNMKGRFGRGNRAHSVIKSGEICMKEQDHNIVNIVLGVKSPYGKTVTVSKLEQVRQNFVSPSSGSAGSAGSSFNVSKFNLQELKPVATQRVVKLNQLQNYAAQTSVIDKDKRKHTKLSHTVEEQNYGANHSRARKYNPLRNNSNDWLSNAQSQCDSMISERYNDLQLCANSRSNSCGSPGKNKKAGVKLKLNNADYQTNLFSEKTMSPKKLFNPDLDIDKEYAINSSNNRRRKQQGININIKLRKQYFD